MGKFGASTRSVRKRMSDSTFARAGRWFPANRPVKVPGGAARQAVRTSENPVRSVGSLSNDVRKR